MAYIRKMLAGNLFLQSILRKKIVDDEIPPVKEEIIVPVVVVDDDVCIDFVKEVLHKENLPVYSTVHT